MHTWITLAMLQKLLPKPCSAVERNCKIIGFGTYSLCENMLPVEVIRQSGCSRG